MQRVNDLRCRVPSPVSGNDMISFIYLYFVGQGSRDAAEISAVLSQEIEQRIQAVPAGNQLRIRRSTACSGCT